MDHPEVINRVKNLVPEIQRTKDPKSALLKLARDERLSPAQLERVAQMFNTAKTLTFLDKSANRGGSFSLVDTEDLLDAYTAHSLPTASQPITKKACADTLDPNDINAWIDTPVQEKQAATRFPRAEWLVDGIFDEKLESDEIDDWKKEAAEQGRQEHATQVVLDLIAEVRDQYSEKVLAKVATLKQAALEGAWTEMEEDALLILGDNARDALNEAATHLAMAGIKVARFEGPSKLKLARDRTGYLKDVAELADAYDTVCNSWELEEMEKEAAGAVEDKPKSQQRKGRKGKGRASEGDDQPRGQAGGAQAAPAGGGQTGGMELNAPQQSQAVLQTRPRGQRMSEERDFPIPRGDNEGKDQSAITGLLSGMQRGRTLIPDTPKRMPWESALGISTPELLVPGVNRKQQQIDDSLADDDSLMMLQRFMASDPVISEADPDMVVEIYNAIRSINPEFAGDPQRMRLALRDAIQYESLPIHSVKDLASLRGETAKGEAAVAKNRGDTYRTAGGKKKDKGKEDA